ncbi:DedA family protein, partial [Yersinia pestis]
MGIVRLYQSQDISVTFNDAITTTI